jgi:hypothetical protein
MYSIAFTVWIKLEAESKGGMVWVSPLQAGYWIFIGDRSNLIASMEVGRKLRLFSHYKDR